MQTAANRPLDTLILLTSWECGHCVMMRRDGSVSDEMHTDSPGVFAWDAAHFRALLTAAPGETARAGSPQARRVLNFHYAPNSIQAVVTEFDLDPDTGAVSARVVADAKHPEGVLDAPPPAALFAATHVFPRWLAMSPEAFALAAAARPGAEAPGAVHLRIAPEAAHPADAVYALLREPAAPIPPGVAASGPPWDVKIRYKHESAAVSFTA